MKIAITGHRPHKLENDYDLKSTLINNIKQNIIDFLKDKEDLTLISGMALGIDTLFAKIAVELNIPFIAAIPFINQDKVWIQKSKDLYNNLLNEALEVVNVSGKDFYNPSYMDMRNKWMVDNCDILIAVWDGTSGGTGNCVKYAVSKNKIIYYIDPKEFK